MSDKPAQAKFPASLSDLIARAGKTAPQRAVEGWNPVNCGEIDIRIDAAGDWYHLGGRIGREALVRLFASILRREPDGRFVLVTPVEKLVIKVDDAPFTAVEMAGEGAGPNQVLDFRTNVGDIVRLDKDHPLRFDVDADHHGLKPYIRVRGGLEAQVTRALMYDLVELAEEHYGVAGLWSGGAFFPLPRDDGA
jgi:hypothetical protein